jgi:hypothetical protein
MIDGGFRNSGHGTNLIRTGCEKIFSNSNIMAIHAYLKPYLDELIRLAPKARYWTPLTIKGDGYPPEETIVRCLLCANGCAIVNGQRGRCRTRLNVKGELKSLVYGRPVSIHVDPIEKKPFYNYLQVLSKLGNIAIITGRSSSSLYAAYQDRRCRTRAKVAGYRFYLQ